MKILVCGGRYRDPRDVSFALEEIDYPKEVTEVISGGASGADKGAELYARRWGIFLRVFPASWDKERKAAGPKRNQRMLEEKPDLVVAFPGGRGTADMVRRAKEAGIEVMEVT